MIIPPILQMISADLQRSSARAILVGGSVRDHFLDLPIKDYDLEIYGLDSLEQLETILRQYGKVKLVGKSFGVLKFIYEGKEYDFAFPRVEWKRGVGHRGFHVEVDGALDFATAARRRDFTINAMGYDIENHLFLDPFGGRKDLEARLLRHIDDMTFIEDPLRVYRGVQFCARFDLTMDPGTEKLCQKMVAEEMLEELPKERIFEEIKKLLLQARRPSSGWVLIKNLGILRDFYVLNTLSEDQWHLLLRRVDMMSLLKPAEESKAIILMLSALCLPCNEDQVATFLEILSDEVKLREEVIPLVVHHGEINHIYSADPKNRDTLLRKLATKVRIRDLVTVARADFWARHEQNIEYEAGEWVLQRAAQLNVLDRSLPPFLQGRDLISHFGLNPSPAFKDILEKVYEMQLKGIIHSREEALKYVQKELL